jgi:N6-L-threonylcarbamoyladenine synthase
LDKGAKLLGLGYPGGPEVERRAREGRADAFSFPRGGGRGDELDFSFSGLKTSLRYQLERMTVAEVEARRADLCASYQAAVIDALAGRVRRVLAREGGGLRSLGLSGGVANNRLLRAALEAEARRGGIPFLAAESRHTGDNAGMIAFAAAVDPAGAVTGDPCRLLIEPNAPLAP